MKIVNRKIYEKGFTLIETIISVGIFFIIAVAIYLSYINVLNAISGSSLHLSTLTIIQNEIEGIRNMAYEDVGLIGGSPAGKLPAQKTVLVGDSPYTVKTTVRNIDDPYDGTIGGTPNDLAPADFKLVEIEVTCTNCATGTAKMTTTIAPQNLESATKNGALFINVFDASGHAISGTNVHVTNSKVTPTITIDDVTNINGVLQLVDIATSSFGYNISISKPGYTSEQTFQPGLPQNPNPTKPFATVAKQQVTSISFKIDRFSTLNVRTADNICRPVGNIDFQQTGTNLIGTSPNIPEYSVSASTNAGGNYTNSSLKWDTYNFQNLSANYDIAGTFSLMPLVIDPNTTYNLAWLMKPKQPNSVLVTVLDQNGQLVDDSKVTLTRTGFSALGMTGRSYIQFSDWSGSQYSQKSPYLQADDPAGSLVLGQIDGKYATDSFEWLESSTIDFGAADTTFYNLSWSPNSQPPPAGTDSLRIQIATNNDNATWNYIGPDGTAGSYYTISSTQINSAHNNNRYLRYKVYLSSQNENASPRLDDLTIDFRSSCIPSGQTFFNGLTSGIYTVTVEKSGYQTLINPSLSVTTPWQEYRANIIP